jgi:hypothetical protein
LLKLINKFSFFIFLCFLIASCGGGGGGGAASQSTATSSAVAAPAINADGSCNYSQDPNLCVKGSIYGVPTGETLVQHYYAGPGIGATRNDPLLATLDLSTNGPFNYVVNLGSYYQPITYNGQSNVQNFGYDWGDSAGYTAPTYSCWSSFHTVGQLAYCYSRVGNLSDVGAITMLETTINGTYYPGQTAYYAAILPVLGVLTAGDMSGGELIRLPLQQVQITSSDSTVAEVVQESNNEWYLKIGRSGTAVLTATYLGFSTTATVTTKNYGTDTSSSTPYAKRFSIW